MADMYFRFRGEITFPFHIHNQNDLDIVKKTIFIILTMIKQAIKWVQDTFIIKCSLRISADFEIAVWVFNRTGRYLLDAKFYTGGLTFKFGYEKCKIFIHTKCLNRKGQIF